MASMNPLSLVTEVGKLCNNLEHLIDELEPELEFMKSKKFLKNLKKLSENTKKYHFYEIEN